MRRRHFSDEVLSEWISCGFRYVLFTEKPDEYHILIKPVKDPKELLGKILYESHLLSIEKCNSQEIQKIHFIDPNDKLLCDE